MSESTPDFRTTPRKAFPPTHPLFKILVEEFKVAPAALEELNDELVVAAPSLEN